MGKLFADTQKYLLDGWPVLRGVAATKDVGTLTGYPVFKADHASELKIVPGVIKLISAYMPTMGSLPVLCEEAETSGVASLVENTILDCGEDMKDLPPGYYSFDGVDFSIGFRDRMWPRCAISAGVIIDYKPSIGMVKLMDDRIDLYHTGISDQEGVFCGERPHAEWCLDAQPVRKSILGIDDCSAIDPEYRQLVLGNILREAAYAQIMPSVAGGIGVLTGQLALYITPNGRNFDHAAITALCLAAGMVVRQLDGSELPWNCTRPRLPVVYARDEEAFAFAQVQSSDWLDLQQQKQSTASAV